MKNLFLMVLVCLLMAVPAMADKPSGKACKGKKCETTDSGGSDSGDGGYSTGDQVGTTDGDCPPGEVWLDLYDRCIPIS